MVLAEVPLWVVHRTTTTTNSAAQVFSPGETGAPARAVNDHKHHPQLNKSAPTEAASVVNGIHDLRCAAETLECLRERRKSAIYSIDCHGSVFATAGGDGTVRLWNTAALFSTTTTTADAVTQNLSKTEASAITPIDGSVDAETGAFVTSNSSFGSDSDGDDDNEAQDVDENVVTDDIGVDADLDEIKIGKSKQKIVDEESLSPLIQSSSRFAVHDLNSVARRKKDGSHFPVSPSKSNNVASSCPPTAVDTNGSSGRIAASQPDCLPRLLATLSAHTGSSVLVVRFSPSGRYLASAGDDAVVCIYMDQTNNTRSSDTGGKNNQNNLLLSEKVVWTRIKICRGHNLDIVDLTWAPDGSYLVSCSLDSETPIIVWKTTELAAFEFSTHKATSIPMGVLSPFKVLGRNIHTSTVRGVAFDPAGSYVASSGDDPAVCIWRAHDDWGLEQRIDASTGIFRKPRNTVVGEDPILNSSAGAAAATSSDSNLFRRITWSTDGAFLCSTNSVVKNKHVASTICRQGWTVSSAQQGRASAPGAANLVGHKQPVVVSRHAAHLLDIRKRTGEEDDEEDEEDEPEYATLLALGDKWGFVTVWSTHKSRPIFKMQCSEHRVTVTDLAWSRMADGNILLLVSMLDGQVVALRFGVPIELGPLLSAAEQSKVFQARYGIDIVGHEFNDNAANGNYGHRLFVGENAASTFVENAMQMSLEQNLEAQEDDDGNKSVGDYAIQEPSDDSIIPIHLQAPIKSQQQETKKDGKKRIRPVSLTAMETAMSTTTKPAKTTINTGEDESIAHKKKQRKLLNPVQNALQAAEKASLVVKHAVTSSAYKGNRDDTTAPDEQLHQKALLSMEQKQLETKSAVIATGVIDHGITVGGTLNLLSTPNIAHQLDRLHSVNLPLLKSTSITETALTPTNLIFTAECTNSNKSSIRSGGKTIPCIDLSVSNSGTAVWRDQILGTNCCALAASTSSLAVGTTDGSLYLFGTSPTLGWSCGSSFRSHPPLVFGHAIVKLQFQEKESTQNGGVNALEMLVVTADGIFAVYSMLPVLKLQYKGTIMTAMTHSMNSTPVKDGLTPKLHQLQLIESGELILLLSMEANVNQNSNEFHGNNNLRASTSTALEVERGLLQAFLYDRFSELWMRISDSRFILSDFHSALPSRLKKGVLATVDDVVRSCPAHTVLKSSLRARFPSEVALDRYSDAMYDDEVSRNFIVTRSHCEDRMSCALALHSSDEFKFWLKCYAEALATSGQTASLRLLIDLLLGNSTNELDPVTKDVKPFWCVDSFSNVLNMNPEELVKTVVIPQISKNRSLQRLTNEILLELDHRTLMKSHNAT